MAIPGEKAGSADPDAKKLESAGCQIKEVRREVVALLSVIMARSLAPEESETVVFFYQKQDLQYAETALTKLEKRRRAVDVPSCR